MKSLLKTIMILSCFLYLTTNSYANSSNQFISVSIPASYEIDFNTSGYKPIINPEQGEKVGEITITCNVSSFYIKYYTANTTYILGNKGYLVKNDGNILNPNDRIEYKVFFSNNSMINHEHDTDFPDSIEKASPPTKFENDNSFSFGGSKVTNSGKYDINIFIDNNEFKKTMSGEYTSELTMVLSDT